MFHVISFHIQSSHQKLCTVLLVHTEKLSELYILTNSGIKADSKNTMGKKFGTTFM